MDCRFTRLRFAARFFTIALPALMAATSIVATAPAQAQTKPTRQTPAEERLQSRALVQQLLREGKIMRSGEAKRGMKGYALSVFQGTTIEKFPIEVIGNLEKVMGGGDLVLIRVTGGTVVKRQSGIVQGMSGSPVYINGKLLGAIAIGFGFPKEPIGGVTPITQMIETTLPDPARAKTVPQNATPKAPATAPRNAALNEVYRPKEPLTVAGKKIERVVVSRDSKRLALQDGPKGTTMNMRPISLLLQVSGMSQASIARLRPIFANYGIEPVQGGGAMTGGAMSAFSPAQAFGPPSRKTGVNPAFIPGGAIGVQLASGDIDMTGVGTITYRIGNRVLGFGHPMFGIGAVSMPMTTSYIHEIFPSYQISFKLASPVQTVGELQQDNAFAVGGTLHMKPQMVPMTVNLRNPGRQINRTYNVQLIKDPLLTPQLALSIAVEAVTGTLGADSDKMLRVGMTMQLADGTSISRKNYLYAQDDITMPAIAELLQALMLTQANPYKRGAIKSVKLDVAIEPTRKTARIKRIFADRNKVKAGENFRVNVVLEPTTNPDKPVTRTFTFRVPEDAPTGAVRVAAGPSDDYWALQTRVGEAPPRPNNLPELLQAYSKLGSADELMVTASTPRTFLMVDRTRVPNPPASWQRLLRSAPSTTIGAYNETQVAKEKSEYSLSGSQMLVVAVESRKHSDKYSPDSAANTAGSDSTPSVSSSPITPSVPDIEDMEGMDFESSSRVLVSTPEEFAVALRILGGERKLLSSLLNGNASTLKALPMSLSAPARGTLQSQAQAWREQTLRAQQTAQEARRMAAAPITLAQPTPAAGATPAPGAPAGSPTPTPTPTETGKDLGRPAARWTQASAEEFGRGDFSGTQVTNDGVIQLAPAGRRVAAIAEPFAWSVAADGRGNTFVGTGNEARIVRINANGDASTLYDGEEVAVTALATDAAGNLYAGVSPGGRVLRFAPNSTKPTVVLNTRQTFVWALQFDAQGRLLVATGGAQGQLFRVENAATASGLSSAPLTTLPQRHIRAISVRGDQIFAGTSDDAVLYEINSSGASTALFSVTPAQPANPSSSAGSGSSSASISATSSVNSAALLLSSGGAASSMFAGSPQNTPEILSVNATASGVYFGTSTGGAIYRWTAENGVQSIYTAPGATAVYALTSTQDGTLYAATGDRGLVYQIRPGNNVKETRVATFLEPAPQQALSLSVSPTNELVIGTGNSAAAYRVPLTVPTSGLFLSNVFDAKNVVRWGALRVLGSGVTIETRSGNTLEPDATWSAWQTTSSNELGEQSVVSPAARYFQYRAKLNSSGNEAPRLTRVETIFRTVNNTPTISVSAPRGAEFWKGKQKITWTGADPDSDTLRYRAWISADNGQTWQPLTLTDATSASYELDTTKWKDGVYRVRVEASDAARNPDDPRKAEDTGLSFTIDNTAPKLSGATAVATEAGKAWRITANASDDLSPLTGAEWRIVKPPATASTPQASTQQTGAPSAATPATTPTSSTQPATATSPATASTSTTASANEWNAMAASDGIFDSRREDVVAVIDSEDGGASGKTIELRTRDSAGNAKTVTVTLP